MATKRNSYNKTDLETIKKSLIAEKTRIEKELGLFVQDRPHETADFDKSFRDMGDEVDDNVHEVEEYVVNKSLEIGLESTLRDIKKSLDRIEKGDYGICKYCDKEIDIKRLTARPTSSSCVSCKKTLTDEA
jgi:DnaK suppressor protein